MHFLLSYPMLVIRITPLRNQTLKLSKKNTFLNYLKYCPSKTNTHHKVSHIIFSEKPPLILHSQTTSK